MSIFEECGAFKTTTTKIRSSDENSHYISANTMQLLPVLPQQLGHTFDIAVKHPGKPDIGISEVARFRR